MVKVYASITGLPDSAVSKALDDVLAAEVDGLHFDLQDSAGSFSPDRVSGICCYANMKRGNRTLFPVVHMHRTDLHLAVPDYKQAVDAAITLPYGSFAADPKILIEYLDYVRREAPVRKAGISFRTADVRNGFDHNIMLFSDYAVVDCSQPGDDSTPMLPDAYLCVQTVASWVQSLRKRFRMRLPLFVEGKVNAKNAGKLVYAGADALVLGSPLFSSDDYSGFISSVRHASHGPGR